jgi:curved DNA-binding protein
VQIVLHYAANAWSICAAFLVASAVCLVAYKRSRGQSGDTQIALDLTAAEAAAGKEIRVTIPDGLETITVKIPAGARNGTRLRIQGKGRPGKTGTAAGDLYILLNVK